MQLFGYNIWAIGQYWGYCAPLFGGEAGSPSDTMPPGPRTTSIPGGILIHPAVWPQQAKGAGSPSNNVARAEAYLHAKFHLDAFNRLATIRQRYRQDRQQSDSVGRTILQTVDQNGHVTVPTPI